MLAEKETRDVIDVSDIDQINWSDQGIDDYILKKISKFADGDYSFEKHIEPIYGPLPGYHSAFHGLTELKNALSLLKTERAKMFFLEKTRFNKGFCRDIIPSLLNHNIIKVLEGNFFFSDETHKSLFEKGLGHKYDFDLCEIAIPYLHGDQALLVKVINCGSDEFINSNGPYRLFIDSLKYLSHETIVMGLDFWGENTSLSSSEVLSLPEETIMYMMRKSSYKGHRIFAVDGLYNKDYLMEILDKTNDDDAKEWVKRRLKILNLNLE